MHFVMKDTNYRYTKKNPCEMYDYRGNALGVFHGITACFLAFYSMFFACGEGNNFFNSTECAETPRNITILLATFSGSYFMADLILILYHTGMETTLQKQYVVHHAIGWAGITLVLLAHNYYTVVCMAFLSTEISAPFPNIRYLLFQHGYTNSSNMHFYNSMFLALTFLFGRMVLFILILFLSAIPYTFKLLFAPGSYSVAYYSLVVFVSVLFLSVFFLNCYWAYAIVKMVIKVLKGGNLPSEKQNPDPESVSNASGNFGRAKE